MIRVKIRVRDKVIRLEIRIGIDSSFLMHDKCNLPCHMSQSLCLPRCAPVSELEVRFRFKSGLSQV